MPKKKNDQLRPISSSPPIGGPKSDAEVRRDAHRRVGRLVPLLRNEVGDHRRVGAAADRAADRRRRHQRQPEEDAVPGEAVADEGQRERHPAEEDHRLAPDVVGEMPAEVAGDDPDERRAEEGEAELALRRTELVDRPDADERPAGRERGRADQRHGEHRPQGQIDVAAPDQAEETVEETHRPIPAGPALTPADARRLRGHGPARAPDRGPRPAAPGRGRRAGERSPPDAPAAVRRAPARERPPRRQ